MAGSNPQITAIVSAKDDASETLKGIARLAKQVAAEMDKAPGSGMARSLDRATAAAHKHASAIDNITKAFKGLAQAAAAYAAYKLPHIAAEGLQEGIKLQHEEFQLKLAGIPTNEIEAAKKQVVGETAKSPNVSIEAGLELYKELRSVLKDVKDVPTLLPSMIKAKAALDSADPTGASSKGLQFLVKGAEVSGIANNPERFEHFIDAAVKSIQAMGRTINPEQIGDLLKFEKTAGASLSDKFQMTTALSLAQELGGSTAGVALNQFSKQMIGGFQGNLHSAAKEFVALGLAQKADFELTKTGEIKGMKPGKRVVGSEVAQRDPFEYVQKYLLPALQSHGFDTQDKQLAEVRRLYPNSNAADLVSKLITQAESFENHAKLYDQALGINADLTKDAATQLTALGTSIKDLGAVATLPIVGDISTALAKTSAGIRSFISGLTDWQKDHPALAKGAVVGGAVATIGTVVLGATVAKAFLKDLLGSAALDKSALALDVAAERLSAAAARLGAGAGSTAAKSAGAAGAVATVAEVGSGVTAGGAAALAGTAIATTALAEGTIYGIMKGLVGLGIVDPTHKGDAFGHFEVTQKGRYQTRTWMPKWDSLDRPDITPADDHTMHGFKSDFEGSYRSTGRGQKMFVADLSRPKPLYDDSLPAPVGWANKPMAPIGPAGDYGAARNIPSAPYPVLAPQPQKVETAVSVSGEALVISRVLVEPSSTLLSIVKGAEATVRMNLNQSGKLGTTMSGGTNSVGAVAPGLATFQPTTRGY